MLGGLPWPAVADFREWTGAASGNWSNPNNWSPAGLPQASEVLRIFDGGGGTLIKAGVDGLTEAFQLDGTGLGGTNGALQITVGGTTTGNIF